MDRPAYSVAYGGRAAALRWAVALCAATGGVVLFLLIAVTSEPDITTAPPKLLELGYVVLPAPPKEKPKPVKPPEPPPKPAEPPVDEPPPLPREQAPLAPSEPAAGPAEIASAPARPAPPRTVPIANAAELDNTEFSPIVNIKPLYPPIALKAAIEGFVDVDLVIDEKGRIESFSLARVSGHPSFGNETAKVIPRWRFPPPRIRGKKAKIKYLYRVNFTLN